MKNTINKDLKVGTKVRYILPNGSFQAIREYKEAVITGEYHDGRLNWICLDNGDKMFEQALTVCEPLMKKDIVPGLRVKDRLIPFLTTIVKSEVDENGMVEVLKVVHPTDIGDDFFYECTSKVSYLSIILNSRK